MLEQLTQLVKEHLGGNSQLSSAIPSGQQDAVHGEIANQIAQHLATQAPQQGGVDGLLSKLGGGLNSGNPITNAIVGGLVSTIGAKFGLPPLATGAIAAALPAILQKFANKAADPNDTSVTTDSITKSLGDLGGGGSLSSALCGLFK